MIKSFIIIFSVVCAQQVLAGDASEIEALKAQIAQCRTGNQPGQVGGHKRVEKQRVTSNCKKEGTTAGIERMQAALASAGPTAKGYHGFADPVHRMGSYFGVSVCETCDGFYQRLAQIEARQRNNTAIPSEIQEVIKQRTEAIRASSLDPSEKDKLISLFSLAIKSDIPSSGEYELFPDFCGLSAAEYQALEVDERLSFLLAYKGFLSRKIDDTTRVAPVPPLLPSSPQRMTAIQLYNHSCDAGLGKSVHLFRRSTLNAIRVAGALEMGTSFKNMLDDMNKEIGSFWIHCSSPFACKAGRRSGSGNPNKRVVVAVSRYNHLLVAFYGTNTHDQKMNDLFVTDILKGFSKKTPESGYESWYSDLFGKNRFVRGHAGFVDAAESCVVDMLKSLDAVTRSVGKTLADMQFVFVGHSLGGATSIVSGLHMLNYLKQKGVPINDNNVVAITLGQPRVFQTKGWTQRSIDGSECVSCFGGQQNWLRIVTSHNKSYASDGVTHLPPRFSLLGSAEISSVLGVPYYNDYGTYHPVLVKQENLLGPTAEAIVDQILVERPQYRLLKDLLLFLAEHFLYHNLNKYEEGMMQDGNVGA